MFNVGDILATRNGLTEYEVERVHFDVDGNHTGYTVVEAHLLDTYKRIARRYRVERDDLVPSARCAINCNSPLAA